VRIEVRDLRVLGTHGVLPEERGRAQPFSVDFWVEIDRELLVATLERHSQEEREVRDELSSTVDYSSLVNAVGSVIEGTSHQLLESLAEEICGCLLGDPAIKEASVTLRKLRPPIPWDAAFAAVSVGRSREKEPVLAYLGMGSNQGSRAQILANALESLAKFSGVRLLGVSGVYETEPVGGPEQPDFLNLVAVVLTNLSPQELLSVAMELEQQAGRVRVEHWGPRSLDVDLLMVGDICLSSPELTLPHPRMFERRFVIEPLLELCAPEELPKSLVPSGWLADPYAGLLGEVRRLGMLDQVLERERHPL
jgi:dihydroneopterin aldolase/2-amino-4-hydroxy-6-hydroxymethyldihydropteridine diphosphokinase